MIRTVMLLVALVTIGTVSAQTPPPPPPPTPVGPGEKGVQKPPQPTEIVVSGWVKQIQSACLTCKPPEVRFCLITENSATSCGTYFVYQNSAKDEVGSNYTALLTALGSIKSLSVYYPNPSLAPPGEAVMGQFQPGTEKNPQLVNRILILAPDQPPPPGGIAKPYKYDYVIAVQIFDSRLRIGVKGNFSPDHYACGDHNFVTSARPISDPETQAMESVALASLLGMKSVFIWVANCEKDDGIMTGIDISQDQITVSQSISNSQQPTTCLSNADCKNGWICQPIVSASGTKVQEPSAQGGLPAVQTKTCVPPPPKPTSCTKQEDCAKGEACIQGKCMAE